MSAYKCPIRVGRFLNPLLFPLPTLSIIFLIMRNVIRLLVVSNYVHSTHTLTSKTYHRPTWGKLFSGSFFMQLLFVHLFTDWSTKYATRHHYSKWICSFVGACLTSRRITFCEKRKGTFECRNVDTYMRNKYQRQRRKKNVPVIKYFCQIHFVKSKIHSLC